MGKSRQSKQSINQSSKQDFDSMTTTAQPAAVVKRDIYMEVVPQPKHGDELKIKTT